VRTLRYLLLGLILAAPTGAQQPPALRVDLEVGGVSMTFGTSLLATSVGEALEGGLPVRIRVHTELWRDRFLDQQVARHEWGAVLLFDALERVFLVDTGEGETRRFATLAEVTSHLDREVASPIRPVDAGTYYYLARLEIETLALSDIEELRRWLRGDLAPILSGAQGVGGAVSGAVSRLLVRALGLPVQRHQLRSSRFSWGG